MQTSASGTIIAHVKREKNGICRELDSFFEEAHTVRQQNTILSPTMLMELSRQCLQHGMNSCKTILFFTTVLPVQD